MFHIAKYLPVTKPSGATNDPLAVWQFKPDGNHLTDRTGNGYDLSVVTGTFDWQYDSLSGLFGLYLDDAQDHELIAPNTEDLRIAKVDGGGGDAALTIEAIINQKVTTSAGSYILGLTGAGETLVTNSLCELYTTDLYYRCFGEYDAGVDADCSFSVTPVTDTVTYIALTISSDGTTKKLYINGVLVDTQVTLAAEKASSSNTQRWRIGRNADGNVDCKGTVFSFRITDETFDATTVLNAYEELAGEPLDITQDSSDKTGISDIYSFPKTTGGQYLYPSDGGGGTIVEGPKTGLSDALSFPASMGPFSTADSGGRGIGSTRDPWRKNFGTKVGLSDALEYWLSEETTWNRATVDSGGRPHFLYRFAKRIFLYDATNDAWNSPTSDNFTGYARNGKKYTSGVEDPGPVYAPWYSEAAGNYRGARSDFPTKSLHVLTEREWIIFDLDSFDGSVASLIMWMRFITGPTTTWYTIGAESYMTLREINFKNGSGYLVTDPAGSQVQGGLYIINFKATGQYVFYNTRSNDDWIAVSGKTIVNRNETGTWTTTGTPNILIQSEYISDVSVGINSGKTFVALGGEEADPTIIRLTGDVPDQLTVVAGDVLGTLEVQNRRKMCFDHRNWFWFSIEKNLYRNGIDFVEGLVIALPIGSHTVDQISRRYLKTTLPNYVKQIVPVRNRLYVATDDGVYQVNTKTMQYHLAYSTPGKGGSGINNVAGTGEILAGGNNNIVQIKAITLDFSGIFVDFLLVATGFDVEASGAITIIRTIDNAVIKSVEFPTLKEPGALACNMIEV